MSWIWDSSKSRRTRVNIRNCFIAVSWAVFPAGPVEMDFNPFTAEARYYHIHIMSSACMRARVCVCVVTGWGVFVYFKPHSDSLLSSKRWSGTHAPRAAAAQLWRLKIILINKTERTSFYSRTFCFPDRLGCWGETNPVPRGVHTRC